MTKAPISLQDLRRRLYVKAKAEPSWRFWGLYVHVCKRETLREAYLQARANDGAPGIDGVTFEAVEAGGAEAFLDQLREELVQRTYRPQGARKVEIPKGGGKMRQLSIPSIRERVVQGALKLILEPIFEADFQPGSFGYRPKKSAHAAIQRVSKAILEGKTYVIDFDLRAYLDAASYCPLVHESWFEECWLLIHDFDSQALTPSLPHQHGVELATLYTLQYRLPRNAEFQRGFQHGQILGRRLLHDARSQLIGDANLPRRAGSDLLAGDEAIGQPAVNAGGVHAQNLRGLADRDQLSSGRLGRRLETRDIAIAAQTADLVGGEAFPDGGLASLTIEDSGDDFIGIKSGQTAQQRDGIFVGARPHRPEAWDGNIQCRDGAAAPAQGQMRVTFGALEIQDHFFQQGAQEFLAIAVGGGGRVPNLTKIAAERLKVLELFESECARALLFAAAQFRFGGRQIAQTIFPFRLQAASDEPILRLHGPVAALGPFGFVARPFDFQTPLRQSGIMVGLELFDTEPQGFDRGGSDRLQKGIRHGSAQSPVRQH